MISDKRKQNIKKGLIPSHVAIIMDGNGRWAKKNTLNITSGHERGVDVVRKIELS